MSFVKGRQNIENDLGQKKRVRNLGLKDDYDYQEGASIVDIMRSHFK